MPKFICPNCNDFLKPKKIKGKTGTKAYYSYKVLVVIKTSNYVCPNDCELREPEKK